MEQIQFINSFVTFFGFKSISDYDTEISQAKFKSKNKETSLINSVNLNMTQIKNLFKTSSMNLSRKSYSVDSVQLCFSVLKHCLQQANIPFEMVHRKDGNFMRLIPINKMLVNYIENPMNDIVHHQTKDYVSLENYQEVNYQEINFLGDDPKFNFYGKLKKGETIPEKTEEFDVAKFLDNRLVHHEIFQPPGKAECENEALMLSFGGSKKYDAGETSFGMIFSKGIFEDKLDKFLIEGDYFVSESIISQNKISNVHDIIKNIEYHLVEIGDISDFTKVHGVNIINPHKNKIIEKVSLCSGIDRQIIIDDIRNMENSGPLLTLLFDTNVKNLLFLRAYIKRDNEFLIERTKKEEDLINDRLPLGEEFNSGDESDNEIVKSKKKDMLDLLDLKIYKSALHELEKTKVELDPSPLFYLNNNKLVYVVTKSILPTLLYNEIYINKNITYHETKFTRVNPNDCYTIINDKDKAIYFKDQNTVDVKLVVKKVDHPIIINNLLFHKIKNIKIKTMDTKMRELENQVCNVKISSGSQDLYSWNFNMTDDIKLKMKEFPLYKIKYHEVKLILKTFEDLEQDEFILVEFEAEKVSDEIIKEFINPIGEKSELWDKDEKIVISHGMIGKIIIRQKDKKLKVIGKNNNTNNSNNSNNSNKINNTKVKKIVKKNK